VRSCDGTRDIIVIRMLKELFKRVLQVAYIYRIDLLDNSLLISYSINK
jgi:hypothetical protein